MEAKLQSTRLVEKIEDIKKRIEGKLSQQNIGGAGSNLGEALEDLRASVEELRVTGEELRLQNEALTRERQRYADLFNLAPDAYLVTDSAGNIQEANRAAGKLLHYAQDFLIGKPLVLFVANEEHGIFRSRLIALRTGGVGEVEEWRITMKPRDIPSFRARMTVTAIRDPVSRLTGLRWVIRTLPGPNR